MTILVPIMLWGWIPVVVGLFALLPPRRAIIVAFIFAWLFLPNASYSFPGFPDYTKMTATVFGVLLGVALFDARRLVSFRFHLYDLPVLLFCASPLVTSPLNGLGLYDGASAALSHVITWGVPYSVGRLYFNDLEGLRDLAIGIFIGGLIYVPLCLWEIRMSPDLHKVLYGFRVRNFQQSVRYGGYRPVVFMWTYIPVVHWLSMSAVVGLWLWIGGRARRFVGIPMTVPLALLLLTLFLCKTFTAAVLVPLGFCIAIVTTRLRTPLPLVVTTVAVMTYMATRASGLWSGQQLVTLSAMVDEARAGSLQVRIDNETLMARRALERPLFGWGGWGRSRPLDDRGRYATFTDGRWIIVLGQQGLVGLVAFVGLFAVPLIRFSRNHRGAVWADPAFAPAGAIATVVLLTFVNNLPNATINPVIALAAGGIVVVKISRSTLPGFAS